jgi:hypothetical protein
MSGARQREATGLLHSLKSDKITDTAFLKGKSMTTLRLSDPLLEVYVALFQQLEPNDQTILLDTLSKSTKNGYNIPEMYFLPKPENALTLEELAGSWDDERSAEEIVADLRASRTRTREVNL